MASELEGWTNSQILENESPSSPDQNRQKTQSCSLQVQMLTRLKPWRLSTMMVSPLEVRLNTSEQSLRKLFVWTLAFDVDLTQYINTQEHVQKAIRAGTSTSDLSSTEDQILTQVDHGTYIYSPKVLDAQVSIKFALSGKVLNWFFSPFMEQVWVELYRLIFLDHWLRDINEIDGFNLKHSA